MVNYEELKDLAISCGFSHVGELDVSTIALHTEVREACAEDKCHAYNKNWVCPPACGTLEECGQKINAYKKGLILQTTGELEDSFDFETMDQLSTDHAKTMHKFSDELKKLYPNALILGDGACKRCKTCTYPDAPCRFPERQSSAMEAFGMVVSEVCMKNNMKYYYGPGTLTYVGCVLVE